MYLRNANRCMTPEFPGYGWLRMKAELKRGVWTANPTRVDRLMREDKLLCVRQRKYAEWIGWALGRTLEGSLTPRALRNAPERAANRPGLVHHSDRGV